MSSQPYEQEVILDADGQPIFAALKQVRQQISEIQDMVAKTAAAANKGVADYGNILRNQAKEIQQSLSQIRSIAGGKNSPGLLIQDLNANKRLAQATTSATEYGRGLAAATSAADGLLAKLNNLNRAIAERGKLGRGETLRQTELRRGFEEQITQIKRLDRELANLERRSSRTALSGGDLSGARRAAETVAAARAPVSAAALSPDRSLIGGEIKAYQSSLDQFDVYLAKIRTKQAQRIQDERQVARAAEQAELAMTASREKGFTSRRAAIEAEESAEAKKHRQMEAMWAAQSAANTRSARESREAESQKLKYLNDTSAAIENQRKAWYKLTEEERIGASLVAKMNAQANVTGVTGAINPRTLFQGQLAAAAGEVRGAVSSGSVSPSTALLGARFEQQLRQNELQKALTKGEQEQIRLATQNLQIADAKVRAAERLTREEQQQIDLQRRLNTTNSGEQQRAQVALAQQYAREQIQSLGAAEAIKRAKQETLNAELRLNDAIAKGTAEQIQQARASLMTAQAREKATNQQGNSPFSAILSGRYALAAFARTSVYGAAAAAAYGLFNTIQNGLQNVVELDDELVKLQAIANATDTQMVALKSSIFEVAGSSRFATTDLVKISQTLAQAGVSAGQMTEVLKSVTTLANASGSTPDEAVNLVTSALGAFQLQASESARVADLMTSALNRTKLTVQQTGQAIQYVGATAYEQDISLEQLLATIGAVAQAGVKSGSTIGTGFRQFLVDLQTPTEKLDFQLKALGLTQADVDVKTRGLSAVLETLKNAGFGSAQAYAGLETRAAAFYLTAKNNLDVVDQLQLSFADQGAATLANERAMDSLSAQWQRFKNIIGDGFADEATSDIDSIKDALKSLNDALQAYDDWSSGVDKNGSVMFQHFGWDIGTATEKFMKWREEVRKGLNDMTGLPIFFDEEAAAADRAAKSVEDNAAKQEQLSTQISNTSDTISTQSNLISELEKEYIRLLTQKDSLINNDQRSAAEMSNLMGRFDGLSGYLTNTKNLYVDLTNAVQGFIAANQEALAGSIAAQQSNLAQQSESLRKSRSTLGADVRSDPNFSKLSPQEKAAVAGIYTHGAGTDEFRRNLAILGTAGKNNAQNSLGPKLNALVQNMAQSQSNQSLTRQLDVQGNAAQAASTGPGSRIASNIATINALIADKKYGEATSLIGNTRTFMRSFTAKPEHQRFMADSLAELNSLENQIKGSQLPTPKEQRAAEKAARAADAQARSVTQSDIDNIVRGMGLSMAGRGHDESPAARARQNDMHARGQTPATADTSAHTSRGGAARDIPMNGKSLEEMNRIAAALEVRFKEAGIPVRIAVETGKGRNQGTGPHIHIQALKGAKVRGSTSEATAQIKIDQYLDQKQLQVDQQSLDLALSDMIKSTTAETFHAAVEKAQTAFEKVNQDLRNQAMNELASKGLMPGDSEWDVRMAQVEKQIQQNTAEYQSKVADAIVSGLNAMLKAAEQKFNETMAPALEAKALADSQLSGLDYASNNGRVPDYVRTLAQRRVGQAAENVDRMRSSALPSEIAAKQAALLQAQTSLKDIPQYDANGIETAAYQKATQAINEQVLALRALRNEKLNLDAALDASSQIPTTLADGLQQAIEAYKETHQLNNTFQQDMIMNMGGILENAHQGFNTFFSDVVRGTETVTQAFGDMVLGIIDYLSQLAIQWLANQAFKAILSVLGASFGGTDLGGGAGASSGGSGIVGALSSAFGGGAWWGGKAEPNGYLGGGRVSNGSTAMDSVNARLARGEWVINRRAVDSVGDGFMAQLNAHGSKALDSLQGMPQIIQAPEQRTNVYVVAPDQKPSLSKNDVLVTMQEDMLNGESRKLIKSISQGG